MRKTADSPGFALLLVLWTLVALSAIALTLAASVQTETIAAQDSWNDLQAERLAKSGHEFANYLKWRSVGSTAEDLSGLPIQPVLAGMTYRVVLDSGTLDLTFEGENKKFDLASAGEDDAAAFLALWTGDIERGREIAASLADWIDGDDEPRALGAESQWYSGHGYLPRNGFLGSADLFLVKGITLQDLAPQVTDSKDGMFLRSGLSTFVAAVPAGNAVNVNYSTRIVLQSVAGMTPAILDSIIEMRQSAIFTSREDLSNRVGLLPDSPLMNRLTFDRGIAPAVLSVARLRNSSKIRSERRTEMDLKRRQRNRIVPIRVLAVVERDSPID
jgi:type II secretory pathway component PulK